MYKITVFSHKGAIVKSGEKRFDTITKEVQQLAKQVAIRNKGFYTRIIPA